MPGNRRILSAIAVYKADTGLRPWPVKKKPKIPHSVITFFGPVKADCLSPPLLYKYNKKAHSIIKKHIV